MYMKNLFYTLGLACLLTACNKEEPAPLPPAPEVPVTITAEELVGTWVYENGTTGVTEVLKFTDGGSFYFSDNLEDILSDTYIKGSYQVGAAGKVSGGCIEKVLNFSVYKMMDYAFTMKDDMTSEKRTYARLVGETVKIDHKESSTPQYAHWISGEITAYKSGNEKTVSVDAVDGKITALSEGVASVYVASTKGTAAVLVKTGGLIPDYADAIGCTQEEVKSVYGEMPTEEFEAFLLYRDEAKSVQFDFNMRTQRVSGVVVKYGNQKGFSNNELVEYLKTKYYLHEEEDDEKIFFDHANKDKATVEIAWDTQKELEFKSISRELFEDFSIAIGMSRGYVERVYGEDLIEDKDRTNDAELLYAIGPDLIGYDGVDKLKTVKFVFSNDTVVSVLVRLKNLTTEVTTTYLKDKYGDSTDKNGDIVNYYDAVSNIKIAYDTAYHQIEYYKKN